MVHSLSDIFILYSFVIYFLSIRMRGDVPSDMLSGIIALSSAIVLSKNLSFVVSPTPDQASLLRP